MKEFCTKLRDKLNDASYRYYAGINFPHIPCEADFSNFRIRVGEERHNQIFHVLVEIVYLLGFFSFDIIAIDFTLFPTYSRYKGCNRFCKDCRAIPVDKLLKRLKNKRDPNKDEKIFGYDAIFITCVEPALHLEIPIACLTISENAEEESQFIPLMEQLKKYHPKVHPKIDFADSKYDT